MIDAKGFVVDSDRGERVEVGVAKDVDLRPRCAPTSTVEMVASDGDVLRRGASLSATTCGARL
jgi:hypothetical protein